MLPLVATWQVLSTAGGGDTALSRIGGSFGRIHKPGRPVSRPGSRGWTPRLAIVREDAREVGLGGRWRVRVLGKRKQNGPTL